MAKTFKMTSALTAILASIGSGATTHVSKSDDITSLVGEGYIEVNPAVLDDNGNAAVRLTEKGKAEVPAADGAGGAGGGAAPEEAPNLFVIVQSAELPVKPTREAKARKPRESKYPFGDIPLGGVLFIAAKDGVDTKSMSKTFGSSISGFNKNNPEKYLTVRKVDDGKAAGFALPDDPEAFAGKGGLAVYHRPVSEKPVRAPRKPRGTANAAAGTAAA